jgi:hypothetical protein
MAVMATLIVLLIAGGTTWGIYDYKQDGKREQALIDRIAEITLQNEIDKEEAAKKQAELDAQIKKMQAEYEKAQKEGKAITSGKTNNKTIAACEPSVYFVLMRKIVLTYEGQTKTFENVGAGTGFLLNDGRFITARHVVEPWMYPTNENDEVNLLCNAIAHNGGKVVCHLEAYSPTGKKLTFQSTNARINRSSDNSQVIDGVRFVTASLDASDYAYFRTNETGGLPYDNALSRRLPVQAKLTVLGYPMGIGANSPTDIHPIYSEAVVAREGLQNGLILTTATTFEHGNSGGPVFATTTDGELIVVGIVSAGAGRSTGFVVPIASIQ